MAMRSVRPLPKCHEHGVCREPGEAVRALPTQTRDAMPDVPWASIAGLRNIVVHEYLRVSPDLILDIVDHQLGPLAQRLRSL